jgi:hypothetical protein
MALAAKPGSELVWGTHAVIEHGGVDVQAADLIGVVRPPVPDILPNRSGWFCG